LYYRDTRRSQISKLFPYTSLFRSRKTGNIKAMPSVLDELIRLNPEKVDYYHEKAYALFLDKKYEAALATCDTITARFGNIEEQQDRKSTRLNSSHVKISYAVFCLK